VAFKVYRSSAGSGKTFTLVKEYLKLCLAGIETENAFVFRSILAITFTNKATAEMKNRVISSLEGLATWPWNHKVQPMGKLLAAELNLPESIIQERSHRIFRTILHRYEDFSILTIDKFTSKVIRSFSKDLGLNQDFEIELDTDKVLHQAVVNVLDQVAYDANLKRALVDFAVNKTEGKKSHRIFDDLFSFSKNLTKEETYLKLDYYREFSLSSLLETKAIMQEREKVIQSKGQAIGLEMKALFEKHQIPYDVFSHGKSGFGSFWKKLWEGEVKLMPLRVQSTRRDRNFVAKTNKEWVERIRGVEESILAICDQYEAYLNQHWSDLVLLGNALKNFSSLAVLNEVEKALLELKELLNIVLISDFNLMTSGIVSTEPAPFIYEKLGQRYQHFLIDEFQDTSVMQWLNLLPLIDESLGNDNFTLLVGDAKQAIYRFRGGEVEQFANLPDIYLSQGLIARKMEVSDRQRFNQLKAIRQQRLQDNFELNSLRMNRRSKTEIVEFNNRLYSFLHNKISERNQLIFADYLQDSDPANTGGMVEMALWEKEDFEEQDVQETNWNWTLQCIQSVLADGYTYGDIAILTRSNKDGSFTAEQLLKQGMPVVSADSLLVVSSPNVKLLLALANALCRPSDTLSLAIAAKYLTAKFGVDLNKLIPKLRIEGIQSILALHPKRIDKSYLMGLPLYDFFLELTEICLDQVDINTQFLLDESLNYSKRYGDNLIAFLNFFEDREDKLKIKTTDAGDSISVMSIHKSKGLEFPVVIMPFLYAQTKKHTFNFWHDIADWEVPSILLSSHTDLEATEAKADYFLEMDKEVLDGLNVCYVATTRPRERLYLYLQTKKKEEGSFSLYQAISQFALASQNEVEPMLYRWGIPKLAVKTEKKQEIETPIPMLKLETSSHWRNNLLVKADLEEGQAEAVKEAISYGILVHEAMSFIQTQGDVERSVEQLIARNRLEAGAQHDFSRYLNGLVEHPHLKEFFDTGWTVFNERELLLPSGKSLRPDRVVIKNGKAVVIDFKTGLASLKHGKQLQEYGDCLRQMGYTVEKLMLYYTENGEVVLV
jgi:ATP-dependent exoDNAse (exonuclease V) beta subunit